MRSPLTQYEKKQEQKSRRHALFFHIPPVHAAKVVPASSQIYAACALSNLFLPIDFFGGKLLVFPFIAVTVMVLACFIFMRSGRSRIIHLSLSTFRANVRRRRALYLSLDDMKPQMGGLR